MKKDISIFLCFAFVLLLVMVAIPFCGFTSVFAEDYIEVKVGYDDNSAFMSIEDDGVYSGYGVDYLNKIAEYTNIKYVYVHDSWSNLLKKLENKEIDLLCSAVYTDERDAIFNYSKESLGYETNILYVKEDDSRYFYNDYAVFDGMKVAAMAGSVRNQYFIDYAEKNGFSMDLMEYNYEYESFEALERGDVDGVITGSLSVMTGYKIVSEFSSEPFYIISNKDDHGLIDEIDDAMEQIRLDDPDFKDNLYTKYYGNKYKDTTPSFTREEAEYIQSIGTITVANQIGRFPLCAVDSDGELYGIQIDFFKQISKMSGLTFKFVAAEPGAKAVDVLSNTDAKIFNGMATLAINIFSPRLILSEPMYDSDIGLIGRKTQIVDYDANVTFALPKNFVKGDVLVKDVFPNATVKYYETGEDCLKAIANNKADYSLQDNYICSAILQKPYYEDLKFIDAYKVSQEFKAAVLDTENPLLLSILNKCITRIGDSTTNSLVAYYTVGNPYQYTFADYFYKYKAAFISVIVFVVLLIIGLICFVCYRRENLLRIERTNKNLELTNAKLENAIYAANAANIAKSDFLSRMSHDMRTPMNAILGLTQLMSDADDINSIKDDLKQVKVSGQYLLRLINDILDVNKIESGKLTLTLKPTTVDALFNNVVSNAKILAQEKGVNFIVNNNRGDSKKWVAVNIDESRLEQVLMNILSNAIKFTPKDGVVTLSMDLVSRDENYIVDKFTISDTGVGMNEDFIPRIFEPFSQEGRINTDRESSTGLGMSIVKRLVELMGGTIDIQSQVNVGTTVTFTVKYEIYHGDLVKEKESNIDYTILENKNILVAEDHPVNFMIVKRLLEKYGINVYHAENGKECVDAFNNSEENYYDLILMDIRMPVMNGLDATKTIRQLDRSDAKEIPIVAMTANAYSDDIDAALEAGMNAHLAKPIVVDLLYKTLSDYLKK